MSEDKENKDKLNNTKSNFVVSENEAVLGHFKGYRMRDNGNKEEAEFVVTDEYIYFEDIKIPYDSVSKIQIDKNSVCDITLEKREKTQPQFKWVVEEREFSELLSTLTEYYSPDVEEEKKQELEYKIAELIVEKERQSENEMSFEIQKKLEPKFFEDDDINAPPLSTPFSKDFRRKRDSFSQDRIELEPSNSLKKVTSNSHPIFLDFNEELMDDKVKCEARPRTKNDVTDYYTKEESKKAIDKATAKFKSLFKNRERDHSQNLEETKNKHSLMLDQMSTSHSRELSSLRDSLMKKEDVHKKDVMELEGKYRTLMERNNANVKKMKKYYKTELDSMGGKYKRDMNDLSKKYEFEMKNMSTAFMKKNKALENGKRRVTKAINNEHNRTINLLKNEYESTYETMDKKYESLLNNVVNEKDHTIAKLEQSFEKSFDKVRNEHTNTLSTVKSQFLRTIKSMENEHVDSTDVLAKQWALTFAKLKNEHEKTCSNYEQVHRQTVKKIEDEYDKTLKEVQSIQEKKFQTLQNERDVTVDVLKKSLQKVVDDMSDRHKASVEEKDLKHIKFIEELQNEYEKSLALMKQQYEGTIKEVNFKYKDLLKTQGEQYEDRIRMIEESNEKIMKDMGSEKTNTLREIKKSFDSAIALIQKKYNQLHEQWTNKYDDMNMQWEGKYINSNEKWKVKYSAMEEKMNLKHDELGKGWSIEYARMNEMWKEKYKNAHTEWENRYKSMTDKMKFNYEKVINRMAEKMEQSNNQWAQKYKQMDSDWTEKYANMNDLWAEKYAEMERQNKYLRGTILLNHNQICVLRKMNQRKDLLLEQAQLEKEKISRNVRRQQEDIKELHVHITNFRTTMEEMNAEIEKLRQNVKDANFARELAEKSLVPYINRVNFLEVRIEKRENELAQIRRQYRESLDFKEKILVDIRWYKGRFALLRQTVHELTVKLNIQKERNDKCEKIITKLMKERSELKEKFKTMSNYKYMFDKLEEKTKGDKERLKELKTEITSLKKDNANLKRVNRGRVKTPQKNRLNKTVNSVIKSDTPKRSLNRSSISKRSMRRGTEGNVEGKMLLEKLKRSEMDNKMKDATIQLLENKLMDIVSSYEGNDENMMKLSKDKESILLLLRELQSPIKMNEEISEIEMDKKNEPMISLNESSIMEDDEFIFDGDDSLNNSKAIKKKKKRKRKLVFKTPRKRKNSKRNKLKSGKKKSFLMSGKLTPLSPPGSPEKEN